MLALTNAQRLFAQIWVHDAPLAQELVGALQQRGRVRCPSLWSDRQTYAPRAGRWMWWCTGLPPCHRPDEGKSKRKFFIFLKSAFVYPNRLLLGRATNVKHKPPKVGNHLFVHIGLLSGPFQHPSARVCTDFHSWPPACAAQPASSTSTACRMICRHLKTQDSNSTSNCNSSAGMSEHKREIPRRR